MDSNATASTALASGGVAGAIVVILSWLIGLAHVVVPAEVAAAMMVILAAGIHAGWLRFAFPPETPEAKPAPAAPPAPAP